MEDWVKKGQDSVTHRMGKNGQNWIALPQIQAQKNRTVWGKNAGGEGEKKKPFTKRDG